MYTRQYVLRLYHRIHLITDAYLKGHTSGSPNTFPGYTKPVCWMLFLSENCACTHLYWLCTESFISYNESGEYSELSDEKIL